MELSANSWQPVMLQWDHRRQDKMGLRFSQEASGSLITTSKTNYEQNRDFDSGTWGCSNRNTAAVCNVLRTPRHERRGATNASTKLFNFKTETNCLNLKSAEM